jgi:hypothetical protein
MDMKTPNKEQAYDAEIAPLMDKIVEVCRKAGISMIAHFEIPTEEAPDLCCTTKTPDEKGSTSDMIGAMLRVTGLKMSKIVGRGGLPRT